MTTRRTPIRRNRGHDFEAWSSTLGTGLDFFGELPADELEEETGGRPSCTPRIEAARSAWERHGARLLAEKAAQPANFGNGSLWALWAFGAPPGADPDVLTVNLAMMRADWDGAPDWADRKAVADWRDHRRAGLRRDAHFAGEVPEWVADHFGTDFEAAPAKG